MFKTKIDPKRNFRVLHDAKHSQAATMVIKPGESEGGPDNKHKGDQWLYVISGSGVAIVKGKRTRLSAGVLLSISAGETHEIKCTGDTSLRTLNIYAPSVY